MAVHRLKKGLDLPIHGAPKQEIAQGPVVHYVAIMNDDYPFMKPRMHVKEGETVKVGQLLFEDRKTEGVRFTAPAAGEVVAIHRGAQRKLESIQIRVEHGDEPHVDFDSYTGKTVDKLDGAEVRALLVESGLWTALRQRPYGNVPSPSTECRSIFVTAIDTRPLAPSPEVVLKGQEDDLQRGLQALAKLTTGPVWFCRKEGSTAAPRGVERLKIEDFAGPHPAGLVGTHIHLLDPASRTRTVWHIGYQDVVAVGKLVATGKLDTERVVALAGPMVKNPRLLRTRLGASTDILAQGELHDGEQRLVSGCVLSGRKALGDVHGYLGRYDLQVSCLAEYREREFIGWLLPGLGKFSTARAFLSGLLFSSKKFNLTTTTNGSHRAMVPIGMYERVMPLDIMPTFLLRALLSEDLENAEKLGALELDAEDLGLCSFVSPGKEDYGTHLRELLTSIWKEG